MVGVGGFRVNGRCFSHDTYGRSYVFAVGVVGHARGAIAFRHGNGAHHTGLFFSRHNRCVVPRHCSVTPIFHTRGRIRPRRRPDIRRTTIRASYNIRVTRPTSIGAIIIVINRHIRHVYNTYCPPRNKAIVNFIDLPSAHFFRNNIFTVILCSNSGTPRHIYLSSVRHHK